MNRLVKVSGALLDGAAGGVALAFIFCMAIGLIAIVTDSSATVPGLFMAIPGRENGALSLEFQPNFAGIVAVVAVTALVRVLLAVRRPKASR